MSTQVKISTADFLAIAKVIAEEIVVIIQQSDDAKKIVDKALDIVENYVKSSTTKLDDAVLNPLCALTRSVLHVPKD